jgi:hypothetical protein
MKMPFTQFTDLDSVTILCPCGASITGEGQEITKFKSDHKEHTDLEIEETITDDGMRVLSDNWPRNHKYKVQE